MDNQPDLMDHQPKLMGWGRLTWLLMGTALCLPSLGIGYEIAKKYGMGAALFGITLGNFLLFCLAYLGAIMSIEYRIPTSEQTERLVGPIGKRLFALVMMVVGLGWFAIQLQFVAKQLVLLAGWESGASMIAFALAMLMVVANYWGIEGITKWAEKTSPMVIAAMLLLLARLCWGDKPTQEASFDWSWNAMPLSLVLAGHIAYAIDQPTSLRFCKSRYDAVMTTWISFLLVISVVQVMGAMAFWYYPCESILVAFSNLSGTFWVSLLIFYLVFQIWAINHCNLFSAQVNLKVCFPILKEKTVWAISAFCAVLLSAAPLLENLEHVLAFMGVLVAGMGGILYCEYALSSWRPRLNRSSIAFSSVVALFASYAAGWYAWSGVAVLDAFVVACTLYVLLRGCCEFMGGAHERSLDYVR